MDIPLHYVPFVPPYVRGFINRHGEPHTVIDPNVLFHQEKIESSTYLVLNVRNDQLAYIISDIHEIMKVPEGDVHPISTEEQKDGFFIGSLSYGDEEVFIIGLANILQRLEYDLEAT
jgi:purine-binding chemotaxis protein CheW